MAVKLWWSGVRSDAAPSLLNDADDEKAIAAVNATDERTRAATNHTEAKLAREGHPSAQLDCDNGFRRQLNRQHTAVEACPGEWLRPHALRLVECVVSVHLPSSEYPTRDRAD